MFIAVLANGAGFYLRRTGVVAPAQYTEFWARYCYPHAENPTRGDEWQCSAYTNPAAIAALRPQPPGAVWYRFTYDLTPFERGLKLLKDVFGLVLVVGSLMLFSKRLAPWPAWRDCGPAGPLAAVGAISFAVSAIVNGPLIAAAGLRSFAFLAIAVCAAWMVPRLATIAVAVAVLVAIQAALVPFEMARGIHLFGHAGWFDLPARAAGTMSQPNSLGAFAVIGMAFCFCFGDRSRGMGVLAVVAALLAILAGSGTGIVCVVLAGAWLAMQAVASRPPRWTGIGLVAAAFVFLLVALPFVTGRPDFYASVDLEGERAQALRTALFGRSAGELVFGSGLGVNTNAALNLMGERGLNLMGAAQPVQALPPDSTVTALLMQVGLVGTALFYFLLVWAARNDAGARVFYAAVAACSLTLNVMELFPANSLLGLALAHSIARRKEAPA